MACIDVKYTRIGGDLRTVFVRQGGDLRTVFARYCGILTTVYAADAEGRLLRTADGEYLIINT